MSHVTRERNGQAVVVGGSLAGLLAARVLSDVYEQVVVLDRDVLPERPVPRRGVPQGRQAHGLLARGAMTIESLIGGFESDVVAAGASIGDAANDIRWYLDGRPILAQESGLPAVMAGRALVEHVVRQRVAAIANVRIVDATEVTGLRVSGDGSLVTGVRLAGADRPVDADLVVDAGGRGSRSPRWLADLGLPEVPRETVELGLSSVSRHFRSRGRHLDGRLGGNSPAHPGQPHSGLVLAEENDTWVVSMNGWFSETPPTDLAGMLAYAGTLDNPDLAEIIRDAEPIGEPAFMRFPHAVRRRYADLAGRPGNYLVAGDALCSLSYVYGQGMTVAALQAQALAEVLRAGTDKLGDRFFAAADAVLDGPWAAATSNDLRFPQAVGVRRPVDPAQAAYLGAVRAATATDPDVARAFLRVFHLVDPASALAAPEIAARIRRPGVNVSSALRRRRLDGIKS
ncbi:squalene monooxygenase [Paractinoplanes maris]|uniref:squalene monooxygenase n=1 Tax=Paractinoplanes maris TaxID=1734446 RepID=UPI0020205B73|nr:squalene monooxygenase [Actinoplanes maris]